MIECQLANNPDYDIPVNSRFVSLAVLLPVISMLVACDKPVEQTEAGKVTYTDDVASVLAKHCVECHVPGQMGAEESGLLMDSYASVMKGSRFGPVVNPGSAMTSSLYILMSGVDRLEVKMPHGRKTISSEEIETVRAWIDNGAVEN